MARAMTWSAARSWSLLGCALATGQGATLGAQSPRYDSTVVVVTGTGPSTFVLISGIIGGVTGFRRLAAVLEQNHRVVVIDPYRLSIDSADVTFAALARTVGVVLGEYGVDSARVVGHAHGAGVALRLAANAPSRVAALYFLDAGALAENRTKLLSSSLKMAPLIARLPGGKGFVRGRYVKALRQNAGSQAWLDSTTLRGYTEPFLNNLSKVIGMAGRLSRAHEPESRDTLVARLAVPVTLLLGAMPHSTAPDSGQLASLTPLGDRLRIERLAGVGHFPHEEETARVAELLVAPLPGSQPAGELTQPSRPERSMLADRAVSSRPEGRGFLAGLEMKGQQAVLRP